MDDDRHVTGDRPRSAVVWLLAAIGALLVLGGILAGLWVLLSVPARSTVTQIEPADEPLTNTPERQAAVSIDEDARAVAAAIAADTGSWTAPIAGVEVVTRLRRPVIEIATTLGPEDAQGAEAFAAELATFLSGLSQDPASVPTYAIQVRSSDGELVTSLAHTDVRWLLEAPPAPTTGIALLGWLSEVYGPGAEVPEPWFARITGIREPAEDADGYVTIETDLDSAIPTDVRQAEWIIAAVNSSGATFAPAVRVTFADPDFEWSSTIDGADPFTSTSP